jgi:cell division transport system permease protein
MSSLSHHGSWFTQGIRMFRRQPLLSFSALITFSISGILLALAILAHLVFGYSLKLLEQRIDINVYFLPQVASEVAQRVQKEILAMPQVSQAVMVSAEESLTLFKKRHEKDALTLQAVAELGQNPFGASLSITAKDSKDYKAIAEFLTSGNGISEDLQASIDTVNYDQNKAIIERAQKTINNIRVFATVVIIFVIVWTLIVSITMLRLGIFHLKEDLEVMRMLGASRRDIESPFLGASVTFGFFAGIIANGFFWLFMLKYITALSQLVGDNSFQEVLLKKSLWISCMVLVLTILISTVSGLIAVRTTDTVQPK